MNDYAAADAAWEAQRANLNANLPTTDLHSVADWADRVEDLRTLFWDFYKDKHGVRPRWLRGDEGVDELVAHLNQLEREPWGE